MGSNFPLFPEAASSTALRVDALFFFWLAVAAFFTIAIFVLLPVLAIKYRRRPGRLIGKAVHGSTPLEIAWSAAPMAIVMVLFVWGAEVFFHMYRPPNETWDVDVVGKRWMWKLEHPNGKREINELHVPVGTAVKLHMTSEDVIHSFYVPAFRVKQDVLPGRYTTLWFRAIKTGKYHLFCAEYCGNEHSKMGGWVTVMEPADFQQWLSGETAGATGPQVSPAAAGAELFTKFACSSCHRKAGPGEPPSLGPNLEGIFGTTVKLQGGATVTVDENYVRESILDPTAKVVDGFLPVMPTFKGQMNEDQVLALVAYVKSLTKSDASASAAAPAGGG